MQWFNTNRGESSKNSHCEFQGPLLETWKMHLSNFDRDWNIPKVRPTPYALPLIKTGADHRMLPSSPTTLFITKACSCVMLNTQPRFIFFIIASPCLHQDNLPQQWAGKKTQESVTGYSTIQGALEHWKRWGADMEHQWRWALFFSSQLAAPLPFSPCLFFTLVSQSVTNLRVSYCAFRHSWYFHFVGSHTSCCR